MAAAWAESGKMSRHLMHSCDRVGIPVWGTAEAKAGRGHLQHGIQDFFKNGFKTFVIEQKEAISKSMSVFAYFTNNPLSSHTSWKI